MYQELSQGGCFFYDQKGEFMISNTGYLITGNNIEYLLVFLNSKFIEFSFRRFYCIVLVETATR